MAPLFFGQRNVGDGRPARRSTIVLGQSRIPAPIHLWRLHGLLVNPEGKPLTNVPVTLSRDNKIVDKTTTDSDGRFAFDHIYGHFQLHIDRTHYSPLDREVIVGIETAELSRKMLYVIAGPGACTDDCSSVFTNKNEFQKTIQRNTQHRY